MKSLLDSILSIEQKNSIIESIKNNRPFVIHSLEHKNVFESEISFLSDLRKLWPAKIDAHLPDVRDEMSSITVDNSEAEKLIKNGMGLLYNHAENHSDFLKECLSSLTSEIGFSNLTFSRCLLYETPKNGGTATHFDQNYNLVFQLSGNKTWWIADNNEIINPLTRHTLNQELDPELASYQTDELPKEMPQSAQEFVLKEGSLLVVPRGAWHKTHASEQSLALNFTFSAPSWLELMTTAMRARLGQDPRWRETAGYFTDQDSCVVAQTKLDALLGELKDEFPHWQAANILGVSES